MEINIALAQHTIAVHWKKLWDEFYDVFAYLSTIIQHQVTPDIHFPDKAESLPKQGYITPHQQNFKWSKGKLMICCRKSRSAILLAHIVNPYYLLGKCIAHVCGKPYSQQLNQEIYVSPPRNRLYLRSFAHCNVCKYVKFSPGLLLGRHNGESLIPNCVHIMFWPV